MQATGHPLESLVQPIRKMSTGLSDFKKRKEEEKARQTGQLAPEVDVTSGKLINPHNPEYITKRPWYLGDSGPSLNHHAKQKSDEPLNLAEAEAILTRRPKFLGRATAYRKGACDNCGAMTHKKKDCVERPRSVAKSAKVTGIDIAQDEAVVKLEDHGKLSWDGKRDQWAGYKAEDHEQVLERYRLMEEERRRQAQEKKDQRFRDREQRRKSKEVRKQQRAEKSKQRTENVIVQIKSATNQGKDSASPGSQAPINDHLADDDDRDKTTDSASDNIDSDTGSDTDSDNESEYDSDEEDEDEGEFLLKDKDKKDFQGRVARQGGVGGAQMKVSVRNLRIREDIAKYLRNLDPNSAYYDPKTRAMRENPLPGTNPEDVPYAGDNHLRNTGDTAELARMQVFAIEAQDQGIDLHAEANPTAAILAKKRFETDQELEKEEQRKRIRTQYGADKYMAKVDNRLLFGQTENWMEYSKDGRVIKGAPKASVRSKYQEDVYINNHTSVWGSHYDRKTARWGYACCLLTMRMSCCVRQETS